MNREEALEWLVDNLKKWGNNHLDFKIFYYESVEWEIIKEVGGIILEHKKYNPITIDDWNRAKIKPYIKIRIESEEHSEYVQRLAIRAGFRWQGRGRNYFDIEYYPRTIHFLSNCTMILDILDNEDKEIFIQMPQRTTDKTEIESFEQQDKLSALIEINKEHYNENARVLSEKVGNNYSHYHKSVEHISYIDVYRVLDLYEVSNPCLQHAIKKLLVSGGRGVKDVEKDITEARDSLNRALEMLCEDKVND